ncbi:DUF1439 domain-containing protein [Oceanisphaera arctica]|uniref:DUF1439 domain-containing protein n=1 Tax=Oceanisphaera arctica TaxID=641510 RepID=A0A2P5TQ23_9GAMM|nr:DUF1439 domain-containing protein [Oceanisphaera arctica]PPL17818.1 hypothetical protein UN63_02905 [Oceanisphaera arctica]GHA23228.1 hypothetical protein GCM10007082_24900 [Oceanisphaera arctica]
MKIILFLIAFGVSGLASAQSLTLTEQQLNQELNHQLGKEFPFSLGSWLSAGIELKKLSVELGRQEADKARVLGQGILSMQQGQQRSQWDIEGDFSARPRYDSEQGALFLDEFKLISYRLNQQTSSPQASMMLPLLLQGLASYLSQYPVYTLDDTDPFQRQLKDKVLSLEIAPGQLLLRGIE